ncbi:unnamed protein product [Caenorhabditis sp. 36 PRJEB53466]|nr:unnamed protein product [Caenorhabditis sp. 36 PRJEB53466]
MSDQVTINSENLHETPITVKWSGEHLRRTPAQALGTIVSNFENDVIQNDDTVRGVEQFEGHEESYELFYPYYSNEVEIEYEEEPRETEFDRSSVYSSDTWTDDSYDADDEYEEISDDEGDEIEEKGVKVAADAKEEEEQIDVVTVDPFDRSTDWMERKLIIVVKEGELELIPVAEYEGEDAEEEQALDFVNEQSDEDNEEEVEMEDVQGNESHSFQEQSEVFGSGDGEHHLEPDQEHQMNTEV